MSRDELIALMAASIFATDEDRNGTYNRKEAMRLAVEDAEMIWTIIRAKEETSR